MNMTEAADKMVALKQALGVPCTATFLQAEFSEYCTGKHFQIRGSLHMPNGVQSWYGDTFELVVAQATAYANQFINNTPPMAGLVDVDMGAAPTYTRQEVLDACRDIMSLVDDDADIEDILVQARKIVRERLPVDAMSAYDRLLDDIEHGDASAENLAARIANLECSVRPITDNSDNLDIKLVASLPAMIADVTPAETV